MLSDRISPALFCAACSLSSCWSAASPRTAVAKVEATFNVLAFYSGTWDAAHIDFEKEAEPAVPAVRAQNGFTYTATNNWDQLNNLSASQYQVVMFLDDSPHTDAQRTGFQQYMDNGGAFFGFHVAAYNDATAAAGRRSTTRCSGPGGSSRTPGDRPRSRCRPRTVRTRRW